MKLPLPAPSLSKHSFSLLLARSFGLRTTHNLVPTQNIDMPHTSSNDPHSTIHELCTALPLTRPPSPSERTLTDSRSSEKAHQKSSSKPERHIRASELCFLWPNGKETPEEQEARMKENLRRSAILASLLVRCDVWFITTCIELVW